jgi:HD-GYP domain-containing protein (c-di-GMP phosphodiesterase class II)
VSEADTLLEAQDKLSRAIDKFRAGEDKELATQVRELGDRFVRIFAGALSMSRIHDLKNQAFESPIRESSRALTELCELLGPIQLVMVEDQVYVNDIRIRFSVETQAIEGMIRMWAGHKVGGLMFHGPLVEDQLRILIRLTSADPVEGDSRTVLQQLLASEGVDQLQLQPPFRFRMRGEKEHKVTVDAKAAYARGASAVTNVWDDLAAGRSLNPLRVRRAVTDLADMAPKDRARGLADMAKDRAVEPMIRHSIQVATLSILIGRALGLSEEGLSDLGVAASFHDSGYGMDEDGFPPPFGRHGSAGVRLMLQQRGFHEARIRRMLVSLEHHKPYRSYPQPTLFARIIRIADDYDTLTRYRAGGPLMLPPEALWRMWAAKGSEYDPTLMQLFVNMVGKYPPGSLLEMAGGSWVTVVSGARSAETWDKPLTLMVRTREGKVPGFELNIDLEKGGEVGRVLTADDLRGSGQFE